ncbi:hypothetical protein ONQ97_25905, partial [Salmonella enterica subsp. enterica serovar Virginia]|nr:hypothetical protein [Salmonella enterica subsp. enterica serovar Virginia]
GQGIEGIEKSFNAQLTGKPGSRLVRKDKFGHVIENITEVNPVQHIEEENNTTETAETLPGLNQLPVKLEFVLYRKNVTLAELEA